LEEVSDLPRCAPDQGSEAFVGRTQRPLLEGGEKKLGWNSFTI